MSRRSVIILAVAAILLTGFSTMLSRRDSRDWRATRSRRLLPFPWQDAASVRIRRPDGAETLFFRAPDNQWNFTHDGLADALNPGMVEELAALAAFAWREPLPNGRPPEPGTATQLTAQSRDGQSVSLVFGEVHHNLRAVCADGDETMVYGVSQDLLGFLDWPSERFRKRYLAGIPGGGQPHRIRLEAGAGVEGGAIELERAPHRWVMRSPVEWPADEGNADRLLRWLDRLHAGEIAAESPGEPSRHGFDSPSAAVEMWYDSPEGQIRQRLEFGDDNSEGGVYVRVAGRDPVFLVSSGLMSALPFGDARDNPGAWRDHFRRRDLDQLDGKTPASVEIRQLLPEAAALRMEVDPASGAWRGRLEGKDGERRFDVDRPLRGEPSRPLTALLSGLEGLRIKGFAADRTPGPETMRWTAFPAVRIVVRFADGTAAPELTVYAKDVSGEVPADGVFFSLSDKPAVLEGFPELARALCRPPYQYQSRHMVRESPQNWRRFERVLGDKKETFVRPESEVNEQWWRQDSASGPLMDGNYRFVAMLAALSQLDSDGFVADGDGDIAEFGLDRPEITAIVYSSPNQSEGNDGPAARILALSVGNAADAEGRRYARLNDAGPVFLLSAAMSAALGEKYE